MLMSECRILSFAAVSEGKAPLWHWEKLSRKCTNIKHRFGCLSYSGTAFEYFMPQIFHPICEKSLIKRSLSLCLSENKRYSRFFRIPFGVSESGSFKNGEYEYKAHGIHTLAVSETETEKTVSPYSNYLFMQYSFKDAYKNYLKLKKIADGYFGLYEAVDFSEDKPQPVKSYMAHHMGMSFLSLVNVLYDRAIEKLFMCSPEHRAFKELLSESDVFVKE